MPDAASGTSGNPAGADRRGLGIRTGHREQYCGRVHATCSREGGHRLRTQAHPHGTRYRIHFAGGLVKRSSIGFRLTVWYFAVLAVGLSLFGVGAWLAMRASLHHAVDHTLRDRVQGVKHFMDEQIASLSVLEIRDEFREHSVLGPGGDLFQVCNDKGEWLYRSAVLENSQIPIRRPDQLGSTPIYEDMVVQRTPVRFAIRRVVVND